MTSEPSPYNDVKSNLRATRILFGAIIAGAVLFALVAVGLHATNALGPAIMGKTEIIRGIVAVMALICLLIALPGYRKSKETAKNLTGSLNDKLANYRSLLIKYLGTCEIATLFSIVGFYLTGDFLLLGVTAIMIGAMLLVTPTKNRLINDLGLDWNEQSQL